METEQFKDEIWKAIPFNPVYLVSNYGRVKTIDHPVWCAVNNSYSIRKGILCAQSNANSKKYWRVGIQINNKQQHFAVHRLVAEAFIPNPDSLPQVNHIDGNKDNNHVSNLEWCTNERNMQHSWEIGLRKSETFSKSCSFRKLSEEQVAEIKSAYIEQQAWLPGRKSRFCKEMAEKYGVKSPNTIGFIVNGETSCHVSLNQDIVQTTNENVFRKMTKEELSESARIYHTGKKSPKRLLIDGKEVDEFLDIAKVSRGRFIAIYRKFNNDIHQTMDYFEKRNQRRNA